MNEIKGSTCMERILLNKINCIIFMEWFIVLGKYKIEYKEEGKVLRIVIIIIVREKWYLKREI